MKNQCYFVVGDGKRIGFWEDPWCNGIPLCLSFRSLFELAGTKGAIVADFWANGNWEFNFGEHFNDWQMDSVQQFLGEVGQKSLNPQDSDKILWKNSVDGLLSLGIAFWKVKVLL